jgi:hypothetical protein
MAGFFEDLSAGTTECWVSCGPVFSSEQERAEYYAERERERALLPQPPAGSWQQIAERVSVKGPGWFYAYKRTDTGEVVYRDRTDGGVEIEIEGTEYDMGETLTKEQALALAEWILAQYKEEPAP